MPSVPPKRVPVTDRERNKLVKFGAKLGKALGELVTIVKGFRDRFLLVLPHVETRRVFIAPSTFHPDETWVKQQAHASLKHVEETGLSATIVMHDRDTKFTASFDEILESADLEAKKSAYRSPNTVAFVERFIQTLQRECLDYFYFIASSAELAGKE